MPEIVGLWLPGVLSAIGLSDVNRRGTRNNVGRIVVTTKVKAPLDRCFDLARDVDVHCRTAAFTSERVVAPGRTSGLLECGDMVTFEGRHLGLRLRLTARIVEMNRPVRFVDEAVKSPFRFLRHVHEFRTRDDGTEMIDTIEWRAPLGVLGLLVDTLFLERHMAWFVKTKQQGLQRLAESLNLSDAGASCNTGAQP